MFYFIETICLSYLFYFACLRFVACFYKKISAKMNVKHELVIGDGVPASGTKCTHRSAAYLQCLQAYSADIVKRNKGVIWQRVSMLSPRIFLQILSYLKPPFGSCPTTKKQLFFLHFCFCINRPV